MISQADIETLANRNAITGSPVLSVYLDIDQSKAVNLNRRFEAALSSMLGSLSMGLNQEEQSSFNLDAEPVRRYVAGLEPQAKGVIVFSDASEDFFWTREIHVPLRSRARWTDTPYLVPLLEILDEHERYGVVLFDKETARLFTVYLGEIEEHADAMAPARYAITKPAAPTTCSRKAAFSTKPQRTCIGTRKTLRRCLIRLSISTLSIGCYWAGRWRQPASCNIFYLNGYVIGWSSAYLCP